MECDLCGSHDIEPERCLDCGGNGDTGAPCELPCKSCDGMGTTGNMICEDCDVLVK